MQSTATLFFKGSAQHMRRLQNACAARGERPSRAGPPDAANSCSGGGRAPGCFPGPRQRRRRRDGREGRTSRAERPSPCLANLPVPLPASAPARSGAAVSCRYPCPGSVGALRNTFGRCVVRLARGVKPTSK